MVVEQLPRADLARVLIVEDDPGIAQTLRRTLRRRGYEAAIVPDGDRAWARLQQGGFAAVILGVRLTRCDGRDLRSAIGRLEGFRPLVLYAGAPDPAAAEGLEQKGVSRVLMQGGVGEELLRAVEAACRATTPVWRARCA